MLRTLVQLRWPFDVKLQQPTPTAPGRRRPDAPQEPDVAEPNDESALSEQQLLIYARDLNDMHQQQRQQLLVLQKLYAELQIKEQHRAQLLAQLLSAQEQERKRIARDIHDGPLQDLGVLLLTIERCKRQLDAGAPAEARATLRRLRQDIQQTIGTLRTLVTDLRPGMLDTGGLLGALDYLAGREGREAQIVVSISSRIGSRLDPALEIAVFRLVQEALTNIRKHAHAEHAWVSLLRDGDELHLEIRDDGVGFAVDERLPAALAAGHIGLASMGERAETAGGRMTIESAPHQGTMLRFTLPFRGAEPGAPALPAGELAHEARS
jgi:signal transduction histidine kinase